MTQLIIISIIVGLAYMTILVTAIVLSFMAENIRDLERRIEILELKKDAR